MFLDSSPIDLHLSKRLRLIRTQCGVTQYELGELIGVTFQQIQKYETALNKMSASRLYEICRVLNKPISSFFDDVSIEDDYYNFEFTPESQVALEDKERSKELMNLSKAFHGIGDAEIRRSIVALVSSLAKAKSVKGA
jgi:transcriptional regulator with XRE-family HTH domain